MTLNEFFNYLNSIDEDVDVMVDGIDCIAVCPPVKLTEEGRKHFAPALELEVEEYCVMGSDEDYDGIDEGTGRLSLAWELLSGLAGYCACEDFDKWFEQE